MQILTMIFNGLIALGILVFVHELGHFLVAKAAGIRVLKFSLGFGQKIIGFQKGGTEYGIAWLPLGGYVKLAGEQYDENAPVEPGDYFSRPWWVRVLVLMAGPFMNLLAAVLVLGTLFWAGFMVPMAKPQVVAVNPASPAAQSGLAAGDVITGLNHQAVEDWEEFSKQINARTLAEPQKPLQLEVTRKGARLNLEVKPYWDPALKRWLIGVTLAAAGTREINRVLVGTPAESAGLKAGDKIVAVEQQPVWTKFDFQNLVWPRAEKPTRLSVLRGNRMLEFEVVPMAQNWPGQGRVGMIGVSFKSSDRERRVQYPFFAAYALGARQTWDITSEILASVGQMLTGKISAKDSVGGPITIVRMAGQEARSGWTDFLFFLAGISIMLGILNLFPIPILDGGNAVFFILEGIRGRPVSRKWQERSQRLGFALLASLMVFATFNDISKLIAPLLGPHP